MSSMLVSVMQMAVLKGAINALMSEDTSIPSATSTSKWTLPISSSPPSGSDAPLSKKAKKRRCAHPIVLNPTPDPMT